MKFFISLTLIAAALLFSSCTLVKLPVKVAGEVVEGTYNVGKSIASHDKEEE